MNKRYLSTIFVMCALYSVCFSQGKIHPDLADKLASRVLRTNQHVTGIVMFNDQVNTESLLSTLPATATRQERHKAVIEALKSKAASVQGAAMSQLAGLSARSQVSSVKSLWIINALVVKGSNAAFQDLAARSDVAMIYLDYPIEGIHPVAQGNSLRIATAAEDGIRLINAPLLWHIGITGQGRLASHVDTGVDGTHPALSGKWRGNQPGVTAAEAWFDPISNTTQPFDSGIHGTHTMGTILGHTDTDTVGVAYGAQWISAGVIDRGGIDETIQYALLAFQWITDPDGNPNTVTDVPDVCSNSWGLSPFYHGVNACDNTFWDAIDNMEAATVVTVFAAGNEGDLGSGSIRTPADRNTTPTNSFSVGALNEDGFTIADYSSLGPSGCPGSPDQQIKPEVVARGSNVRSSIPGGGYTEMSGTSMATPHVAGAVVLLRQAFPNATVDEIKYALMNTATDLGDPGEDNTYGFGLIDVYAAYQYLGLACQSEVDIVDPISSTTSVSASVRIVASSVINNGAHVTFTAGNEILFHPGFHSFNGSFLLASIGSCSGRMAMPSARIAASDTGIQPVSNTLMAETGNAPALYPNPAMDQITLNTNSADLTEGPLSLMIIDVHGRIVFYKEKITQSQLEISLRDWTSGVYFARVYDANKSQDFKIIKK